MKRNLGTVSLDLTPGPGNPRNSEGAFLTLGSGEIIYVYSRFKGDSWADDAFTDVMLMRSADDGRTFTDESLVFTCEEEGGVNAMSLSLLQMENGDIGLFYLVRTNYTLMRMYLRRSSDGGKSWGKRVLCTPMEGYFVVNNDRVVRLSCGRIIIPAAVSFAGIIGEVPDDEKDQIRLNAERSADRFIDSRARDMFFYSDDDGYTWQAAPDSVCLPYSSGTSGLQEPGILELTPGCLWGFARTDLGCQYEMFSMDSGLHWTPCQPSRFTSPCSPLSMKRDESGTIWAVWNPVPMYNGREEPTPDFWAGGRTPYAIACSTDNGRTFCEPVIFEDDEKSGYCYCAIHFTGDAMLLAYCAGGPGDGIILSRTRIRRIEYRELDEIIQGAAK